ncbi:ribonuclease H2, subunit B [Phyllosticta capitalensis]
MKTRSKKQSAPKQAVEQSTSPAATLPTSVSNPPKLFVLPENSSAGSRIVTLANPATGHENRYFCCPETGFFEFTKLAAPKTSPRSWLLAPQSPEKEKAEPTPESSEEDTTAENGKESLSKDPLAKGYTLKAPDAFVATPLDALFLVLPALWSSGKESKKKLFLSVDDHLDTIGGPSLHLRTLLRDEKVKAHLEDRLGAACDTVDAGKEKMYRLSSEKLAKEIMSKAERVVASGLPASMEDKFVRQALEVPIMSVKREESTTFATENIDSQSTDKDDSQTPTLDTQTSMASDGSAHTAATSIPPSPEAKPAAEAKPPISAPEGVPQLLRLRTALEFMLTSYVPATLRSHVKETIASSKLVDFGPLDQHLKHLESLRSEALALRSLSDNISRKHGLDEEEAEARAEKKRKKDEEETKKKNQSRGVKALAKTNTSGMKKLSSFFTKKPST